MCTIHRAKVAITAIFIISFLFHLSKCFEYAPHMDHTIPKPVDMQPLANNKIYDSLMHVLNIAVAVFIPEVSLFILNTLLIYSLVQHNRSMRHIKDKGRQELLQLTLVVITMVSVFMICHSIGLYLAINIAIYSRKQVLFTVIVTPLSIITIFLSPENWLPFLIIFSVTPLSYITTSISLKLFFWNPITPYVRHYYHLLSLKIIIFLPSTCPISLKTVLLLPFLIIFPPSNSSCHSSSIPSISTVLLFALFHYSSHNSLCHGSVLPISLKTVLFVALSHYLSLPVIIVAVLPFLSPEKLSFVALSHYLPLPVTPCHNSSITIPPENCLFLPLCHKHYYHLFSLKNCSFCCPFLIIFPPSNSLW
ncbi:unnamed protein product [Acanthosepion pharaonis]|uniref:G-protein coupled receptors family 1 profile domain-containing protein n=1 Tax=Acanthosepion pharaonis TaxID=158019 RepID=A0A812BH92_ACAPH|nr:unnamed protein product [Sepia pharaonis]